jgi:hypothetical protein
MPRYRLKDDGYPSYQKIMRGKDWVGRVNKNADGSFTGIIGRVEAPGTSWVDAMHQVVAKVEGLDASEISRELVSVKPVQERTQAILNWLANIAEAANGHPHFTNTDLAHAAGWQRPNRALGNLVSRLDLCCFRAGLPAIGCAAENTFKDAWHRPGANRVQFDWSFPVELMQRRAKSHRWTRDDFERIGRESRALLTGSAYLAWDDEMAKHETRIRDWAEEEERVAA